MGGTRRFRTPRCNSNKTMKGAIITTNINVYIIIVFFAIEVISFLLFMHIARITKNDSIAIIVCALAFLVITLRLLYVLLRIWCPEIFWKLWSLRGIMALTSNNLNMIAAIAQNDIHKARAEALASLAEDDTRITKTEKEKYLCWKWQCRILVTSVMLHNTDSYGAFV